MQYPEIFSFWDQMEALEEAFHFVDSSSRDEYIAKIKELNDDGPEGCIDRSNKFVKYLGYLEDYDPVPTAEEQKETWFIETTTDAYLFDNAILPILVARATDKEKPAYARIL